MQEFSWKELIIEKSIGGGAFSNVFVARWQDTVVALKKGLYLRAIKEYKWNWKTYQSLAEQMEPGESIELPLSRKKCIPKRK